MSPRNFVLASLAATLWSAAADAQTAATAGQVATIVMTDPAAVLLARSTSLPGIEGDFDSLAVDLRHDRLFIAAEEHHTIEVFKASTGEHLRSVGGVKTPHALAYVAEKDELVVADGGESAALFLAGDDLHRVDRVALIDGSVTGKTDSPDTAYYDAKRRIFYIGNGGKSANLAYSEIAELDLDTHRIVGKIRVEGNNLEAMAVDEAHDRLFVDVRDRKQVAVVDLKARKVVATWDVGLNRNTGLAYDAANGLVFVGSRQPGLLTVLDAKDGRMVAQMPCADVTDSLTWDPRAKRIYVAGSQGLSVFHQDARDRYTELLRIPTNGGKTALHAPDLKLFYVVHPKTSLDDAGLLVYRTER